MAHSNITDEDPAILDPFRQIFGHTFYYVDSVPGSWKTGTLLRNAIQNTLVEGNTLIVMPTIQLIEESRNDTIKLGKELGIPVSPISIHTGNTPGSIETAIREFISNTKTDGQILFITHAGMHLVIEWPEEVKNWSMYIDEVFDPLLSSGVIKMRQSAHDVAAKPLRDWTMGCMQALPLVHTLGDVGVEKHYYHIAPILNDNPEHGDEWDIVRRHFYGQENDQRLEIFKNIPLWLLQKEALFTNAANWDYLMAPAGFQPANKPSLKKGHFIICGFRRPDRLLGFKKVTIMSALFKSTMLYNLWSRLGIKFKPSPDIKLNKKFMPLGSRQLRIGYLTDSVWSKNSRKKSGGITTIFNVIAESKLIDKNKSVGIIINKDDMSSLTDASVGNSPTLSLDMVIRKHFPKNKRREKHGLKLGLLPHNVRGSNEWTDLHQLIYVAALNSHTPDIKWIEEALGISSLEQRIGRVGHEIYQAFTRLSIRLPDAKENLVLVTMEKMLAEWMVQHFSPKSQVETVYIGDDRIAKPKTVTGRPKGDVPIKKQWSEASKRYRMKKKQQAKNDGAS